MIIKKIKIILNYFYSLYFGINNVNNYKIELPAKIKGRKKLFIGDNTTISSGAWIEIFDNYELFKFTPKKIKIGNNVGIGRFCCITSINEIIIEDGCLISEYFYISDHYHNYNPQNGSPRIQELVSKGKTVIGENTFIGYRVSILSGIELGHNCVVGSHSVVTKSFEPYSMIAGVPAKLIKKYNLETNQWENI